MLTSETKGKYHPLQVILQGKIMEKRSLWRSQYSWLRDLQEGSSARGSTSFPICRLKNTLALIISNLHIKDDTARSATLLIIPKNCKNTNFGLQTVGQSNQKWQTSTIPTIQMPNFKYVHSNFRWNFWSTLIWVFF